MIKFTSIFYYACCALLLFGLGMMGAVWVFNVHAYKTHHPEGAISREVWQLNKKGKVYFYVDHQTRLIVEDCVKHPDGCIVAEQLNEPAEVIVGGKK